jgi:hypothetical protein
MVEVFPLLLQAYVNGPTPVTGVTDAVPLFNPQVVVVDEGESVTATELPTLVVALAEQPIESLTTTE